MLLDAWRAHRTGIFATVARIDHHRVEPKLPQRRLRHPQRREDHPEAQKCLKMSLRVHLGIFNVLPARTMSFFKPFAAFSFDTVVPFRAAIVESESPDLIV